jgi:hypothetical protein
MVFKRPRIDNSESPDYDLNVDSSLRNKINQFISSNISEIETNVREVLALKIQEISEKNLAFTVVAKENSKLMEDNIIKERQNELLVNKQIQLDNSEYNNKHYLSENDKQQNKYIC